MDKKTPVIALFSKTISDTHIIKWPTSLFNRRTNDYNIRSYSSPTFKLPYCTNIHWSAVCVFFSRITDVKVKLSFKISTDALIKVNANIDKTDIKKEFEFETKSNENQYLYLSIPGNVLAKLRNGHAVIFLQIKFLLDLQNRSPLLRLYQCCEHIPRDFKFVVKNKSVTVHKIFFCLISPVLNVALKECFIENKSGELVITDFEFPIVRNAINFCYGKSVQGITVTALIGILKFGDKYDIKSIIHELEPVLLLNLSVETFDDIINYVLACSRDSALETCCRFYKDIDSINEVNQFENLSPSAHVKVLESAYNFDLDEILSHAHNNNLKTVSEYLEKILIDTLSIETFRSAVDYAWTCDRENVKQECAKFLNEHRTEVTTSEDFFKLTPQIMFDVIRLASEPMLNNSEEKSNVCLNDSF